VANLLQTVRALVRPVLDRVKTLAQRGVLRSSNDQKKAQELVVAVLAGETLSRVERLAHFGFLSRAPAGAEVVVLCLGGNRDHPVVVAEEDRRTRPLGLAEGEAGLYSVGGGTLKARITLRADGSVEVLAPGKVKVTGDVEVTGKLTTTANLEAGANVKDSVGTLAAFRTAYNSHTHSDPQGGTTGPPVPTA
jgi:phage baseplate assembly protein V